VVPFSLAAPRALAVAAPLESDIAILGATEAGVVAPFSLAAHRALAVAAPLESGPPRIPIKAKRALAKAAAEWYRACDAGHRLILPTRSNVLIFSFRCKVREIRSGLRNSPTETSVRLRGMDMPPGGWTGRDSTFFTGENWSGLQRLGALAANPKP